jgi:hypothetical protein
MPIEVRINYTSLYQPLSARLFVLYEVGDAYVQQLVTESGTDG